MGTRKLGERGTMKVAILFVAALFVVGALAGGLEDNHASETAAVRKLLMKMLARHEAQLKDVKSKQRSVESSTKALKSQFLSAKKAYEQGEKYEDEMDDIELKEEASVKREKELIAKILAMLGNHAGTSKSHAAKSCGEVMRHGGYKSGMYWIVQGTRVKQVFCQAQSGSGSVRALGQLVFSGGCSHSSKGSGWRYLCQSDEEREFRTQDEEDFAKQSGDTVIVQKKGLYRINVVAHMYAPGHHSRNMQVRIGGHDYVSSWDQGYNWNAMKSDFVRELKVGDKIRVRLYTNHGSGYRWHAKDGVYGYNRLQLSFIGAAKENPMFSGGCSAHSRGNGWATFCVDRTEFDTSTTKKFLRGDFLQSQQQKKAQFKVMRAGIYRFNVEWHCHSNGWTSHHGQIKVNGKWNYRGVYNHHYAAKWSRNEMDQTIRLNKGDKVEIQMHSASGNPYRWHSSGSRFQNNRLQIQYLGANKDVPRLRAGPSGHERHTGWRTLRLESDLDPFTGQQWFTRHGDGRIVIKRDAMYRFNANTLAHSNSFSDRQMRLVVNGKDHARARYYGKSWETNNFDVHVPLKKGDKVKVQVYLSGGGNHYNYHNRGHTYLEVMPVGNFQ